MLVNVSCWPPHLCLTCVYMCAPLGASVPYDPRECIYRTAFGSLGEFLLKASYPLCKEQLGTWGGSLPDLSVWGHFNTDSLCQKTGHAILACPFPLEGYSPHAWISALDQTFSFVESVALFRRNKMTRRRRTTTTTTLSFSEGVKDTHLNTGS